MELIPEEKVILAGHSFGAATAIEAARKTFSNKVIGVFSNDPWLFPFDMALQSEDYKMTLPIANICAESF